MSRSLLTYLLDCRFDIFVVLLVRLVALRYFFLTLVILVQSLFFAEEGSLLVLSAIDESLE